MLYFSRWKSALIWLAIIVGLIIASPNFFSRETLAKLTNFLPKQQVILGLDLSGGSRLILQVQNSSEGQVAQSAAIMERRLHELGYRNPIVEVERRNRIRVEVPGLYDAQLLKDILSIRGNLTFRAVDDSMSSNDAIRGTPPANSEVVYSYDDPPIGYLVQREPIFSIANVIDAEATLSSEDGEPVITLTLDDTARANLAAATAQIGEKTFAII